MEEGIGGGRGRSGGEGQPADKHKSQASARMSRQRTHERTSQPDTAMDTTSTTALSHHQRKLPSQTNRQSSVYILRTFVEQGQDLTCPDQGLFTSQQRFPTSTPIRSRRPNRSPLSWRRRQSTRRKTISRFLLRAITGGESRLTTDSCSSNGCPAVSTDAA